MPIVELSLVSAAILDATAGKLVERLKRREAVIRVLKRLGLDPADPPNDFDGLYAYTLVEYGVTKPEPLLKFFRNEFIREAFRNSFYENNSSILEHEAEDIIQWNHETGKLGHIDYDPRREFASFTAVFNELVDRVRTPTEVRHDQTLAAMRGDLHQGVEHILTTLATLDLSDIRSQLARLAESQAARRFIIAPAGEKLKVFISSTMTELLDVREVVEDALERRGIEAWVYESDAGAGPSDILTSSLREVQAADVFVGIFWKEFGQVTVQEYQEARRMGKPCFIYIRDKHAPRDTRLDEFLHRDVMDPTMGVSYSYFTKAIKLADQVAEDLMAWLVQSHREITAELRQAEMSVSEVERLQGEIRRLQAASKADLPQGSSVDLLAKQMHGWFKALGYHFESHDVRNELYFEWIINIQVRRRYDRILIRGIGRQIEASHVMDLRKAVDKEKTDEGWVVSLRRVSAAARRAVKDKTNRDLSVFTFDELIDQDADFSGYFQWLEQEIKDRKIDRMYVPLACVKEEIDPQTGETVATSRYDETNGWIDGYIDLWQSDPSKEHISILGEFGTGKTWFTLHYAWVMLQRYMKACDAGSERPRLPLVIPLRDYAKAVSVESLFSEFFFRRHEIPLPGYSAFEQLNRMGKLVLIFDGFDEMAARVDRQHMINNFWELARVVVPGAKAILTCRTEHFPEAKEGRALLNAELKASTAALTGEPPQFEVLELEKFDDDQIRTVLLYRSNEAVVDMVMHNEGLMDLVRRPVMTELVLDALPDIRPDQPLDLSRVYLYAVRRKMERDIHDERTFTSMADKLFFLCEVSWEMISSDRMSLNYRLFPERLRRFFGPLVQEEKDLDHWHFDMMGQTMLIRNSEGDYTPAHRSLLEFFVAYKLAAEMGVLADEYVEVARQQSHVDNARTAERLNWTAYFRPRLDATGELEPIAPLAEFCSEDVRQLATTVGQAALSPAVLELLMGMLRPGDTSEILLGILDRLRDQTFEDCGYIGRNVVSVMLSFDRSSLRGKDLSRTCLRQAMFDLGPPGVDLSSTNLRRADLEEADFDNCVLIDADLRDANLAATFIPQSRRHAECVAVSDDGASVVGGGSDGRVWIWRAGNHDPYQVVDVGGTVRSVDMTRDGRYVAIGTDNGDLAVWDVASNTETFRLLRDEIWIQEVAFDEEGTRVIALEWELGQSDYGTERVYELSTGNLLYENANLRRVAAVGYCPSPRKWVTIEPVIPRKKSEDARSLPARVYLQDHDGRRRHSSVNIADLHGPGTRWESARDLEAAIVPSPWPILAGPYLLTPKYDGSEPGSSISIEALTLLDGRLAWRSPRRRSSSEVPRPSDAARSFAFASLVRWASVSDDGRWLAWLIDEGLELWDLAGKREVAKVDLNIGRVLDVRMSRSGRYVAVAGDYPLIRIISVDGAEAGWTARTIRDYDGLKIGGVVGLNAHRQQALRYLGAVDG